MSETHSSGFFCGIINKIKIVGLCSPTYRFLHFTSLKEDVMIACIMKTILPIITLLMITSIAGCGSFSLLHHPKFEQGNLVKAQKVAQLKLGMSKTEVAVLLGTPVLVNTFSTHRWQYVYLLQHGRKTLEEQRLIVTFEKDKVVTIDQA